VPDASTLLLSPFDKSSLKAIEKAINVGGMGCTAHINAEVTMRGDEGMSRVCGIQALAA
jgi:ribosome recycling factor